VECGRGAQSRPHCGSWSRDCTPFAVTVSTNEGTIYREPLGDERLERGEEGSGAPPPEYRAMAGEHRFRPDPQRSAPPSRRRLHRALQAFSACSQSRA
jgi:hypothetical protein